MPHGQVVFLGCRTSTVALTSFWEKEKKEKNVLYEQCYQLLREMRSFANYSLAYTIIRVSSIIITFLNFDQLVHRKSKINL